jgi:single-stranded-DNA-specific exonuclease
LADVSRDLVRFLPYVGPFGIGNGRPVFLARGVRFDGPPRVVGKGHLKAVLVDGDLRLNAIGFGLAERLSPAKWEAERTVVMFQLTENHYRGAATVEARLLDVRPAGEESLPGGAHP